MLRTLIIANNTLTEVIRQPIYLIIVFATFLLVLLSPYVTMFAMLANLPLLKDMGLATLLVMSLLISLFSTIHTIQEELEERSILSIFSKPIPKFIYILGKYFGIIMALAIAQGLITVVFLQVVRVEITEARYSKADYPVILGYITATIITLALAAFANFFYERSFYSSSVSFAIPIFSIFFILIGLVSPKWELQPLCENVDPQLAWATSFIFLSSMILAGIALVASIRTTTLSAVGITIILFLLSLFSDYLFGRHDTIISQIFHRIIPNLQIYLVSDAILDERTIPFEYGISLLMYTLLYVTGLLAFAMALFQSREAS